MARAGYISKDKRGKMKEKIECYFTYPDSEIPHDLREYDRHFLGLLKINLNSI